MIWEPGAAGRMQNLRHELARWVWLARRHKIDYVELEYNLRTLVAVCPDEIIYQADQLKHEVFNQLTKICGKRQLRERGIDFKMRVCPIKKAAKK